MIIIPLMDIKDQILIEFSNSMIELSHTTF